MSNERRDEVASVIWRTSHADEGTISATGANIIANVLIAAGLISAEPPTAPDELIAEARQWPREGSDGRLINELADALAAVLPSVPSDDSDLAEILPKHGTYQYDYRVEGWSCECGKKLEALGTPVPAGIQVMAYRLAQHQIEALGLARSVPVSTTQNGDKR